MEYYAHSVKGKPASSWQLLEDHLKETADLASTFAAKTNLANLGRLAGLLHDIGKYSNAFQEYLKSAAGRQDPDAEPADSKETTKTDHSSAGAQMAWESLNTGDNLSRLLAQVVALCVASHHTGLIDCLSPDGEDKFSNRISKELEETHLKEVRSKADHHVTTGFRKLLDSPALLEEFKQYLRHALSGEQSSEVREFYVSLGVRFLFSTLIDADRLSAAGRAVEIAKNPKVVVWDALIERLERHLARIPRKNQVDDIRADVSSACREFAAWGRGLYRLTVPTGGGKTLSSLRFALHHAARHRMDRVIYVIPYISIIDQNAALARSVLERDQRRSTVVLEYHSNLTPNKETWQANLSADNWDAQVIFTTSVQFLETLFGGGTRSARRMHRLANAVIIFDEIQTLPLKTVHLFNNAINFLVKECSSTVVFCTATQPLLDGVDKMKGSAKLSDTHDMIPHYEKLFEQLKRVDIVDGRKTGGWNEDEIARLACQQATDVGSALVVANTKAQARAIYELCHSRMKEVLHLSTYMCPAHRMRIIWYLKRRLSQNGGKSEPFVCVSTQLIEAGVDLDFGAVIRYLAGLDSIGQAAGRCNRNGRWPSGTVTIVNPLREDFGMLQEIARGREVAERILDEYRADPGALDNNLLSPKAMNRYYEYYFYDRSSEMVYPISAKEIGHDDNLLSLLSTNQLSVQAYATKYGRAPLTPLRQSFKSAGSVFEVIDAPTEGIIVPYGRKGGSLISQLCAVQSIERTRELLREAQRYSVNLFARDRGKLDREHCIHETQNGSGVFYLDKQYYDGKYLGVLFRDKNGMEFLSA